ncbi:MAG: MFS transporter [Candidatus Dojkabacteria bacterium]|nr:MFS transporter [Candidatus Dojkabacteria bacterium]
MFKKLQNTNQLKLYYILEALLAICGTFTHTTYYIYLTTTLGLTNTQAMFLDTVLFVGIFLFELPTGIFGDKYGRKASFIFGRISLAVSLLIYFLSPHYFVLVLGSIVFALGMAFESGAFEAWIVDQVHPGSRQKIFVVRDVIRKISVITIPAISIFIAEKTSYGFPYFISFLLSVFIVLSGLLFMKENKSSIHKDISELKGLEALKKIGVSSIKEVCGNKILKKFFLSLIFSACGFIAVNSFSSRLLADNLGSANVGIITSISSIFSILLILILKKKKLLERLYLICALIGAFSLISIGIYNDQNMILLLMIIQVGMFAVFEIQRQKMLNDNIQFNRATILSVFSFAGSASGMIGTIIFGYLADVINIRFTFSIAGIFMLLSIFLLRRNIKA